MKYDNDPRILKRELSDDFGKIVNTDSRGCKDVTIRHRQILFTIKYFFNSYVIYFPRKKWPRFLNIEWQMLANIEWKLNVYIIQDLK